MINEENKRQVTFSKRSRGLFKKSAELSILCGAQVAVITFSWCGWIYTFGSSNFETLIEKYLHRKPVRLPEEHSGGNSRDVAVAEKEEEDDGRWWWEPPVDRVPDEELPEYLSAIRGLRENVLMRIQHGDDRTVERIEGGNPTAENVVYWKPEVKNPTVENQAPENLAAWNDWGNDSKGDVNFDGKGFVDEFLAQSGLGVLFKKIFICVAAY